MANLTIENGGKTLQAEHTLYLIKMGVQKSVPPSLFICQLYYESHWGNSVVGRTDNNWGGLTWTGKTTRPSGIKVTQGMPRPQLETGYYMHFASTEDFLFDYVYLLTDQKIYNIQNKGSFDVAIKGLFKVGGAYYDYAATPYTEYLNTMLGVRAGINSRNNNILDQIDADPQSFLDGEVEPDPVKPLPDPVKPPDYDKIKDTNEKAVGLIIEELEDMLGKDIFQYGHDKSWGNAYVKVIKQLDNVLKLRMTASFKEELKMVINTGLGEMGEVIEEENTPPKPKPEPDPDPSPPTEPVEDSRKVFPVNPKAAGINFWSPPHASSLQHGMDYGGPRSGRQHAGYDIGGGGKSHKIYNIMNGKVVTVDYQGVSGYRIIIKQVDGYYVLYQHLKEGSTRVKVGDDVTAGRYIADMGKSGGNYAIHLHIEISKTNQFYNMNTTDNPRTYLQVTGDNKTSLRSPV